MDQLTVLAEAFGEPVTPERLRIYAADLEHVPREVMARAFVRARRELLFFPKIAQLLDLCGMGAEKQKALKAAGSVEAWHKVLEIIRVWGVDRRTHAAKGPCPQLDARTEYALRVVGGLRRINECKDSEFGFIQRNFTEAWELWTEVKGANDSLLQLRDLVEPKALPEQAK